MRTKISVAAIMALMLGLAATPARAIITSNILNGPYELRAAGFDDDATDTETPGTLTITGILVFDGGSTVLSADLNVSGEDSTVSNFHCQPGPITSGNYLFLDATHNVTVVTLKYPNSDTCLSGDTITFNVALGITLGATHQVSSGGFSTTLVNQAGTGNGGSCEGTSGEEALNLNFPGVNAKKQRPVCADAMVLDGELVHQ